MGITREGIIDVAFDILDEKGLSGLSIRTICDRLGVKPPTVYWRLGGKPVLLREMSRRFYVEAIKVANEASRDNANPVQWLRTYGATLRDGMLRHPDTAILCATESAGEGDPEGAMRNLVAPLVEMGLSYEVALSSLASVNALTLGWVSYEQRDQGIGYLARVMDFDALYAQSLTSLLAGSLKDA